MPTESIVFAPDLDERRLDREVGQIDDRLAEVGEDVPVNFDAEEMGGLDSLSPMGGGAAGGGLGAAGGAGAVAGLASKIPKPVAGVATAAALPVALSGAVGMGMLSAMTGASARLQTSATLLGQAWNNVWRPIGDKLDQLFIRDLAMGILDATQGFEEWVRGGMDLGEALDFGLDIGSELADFFPSGGIGDVLGVADLFSDAGITSGEIMDAVFGDVPSFTWPTLPTFTWPSVGTPDWPDISAPQWPDISAPEWPDLSAPDWPDIGNLWPGWPDLSMPEFPGWPDVSLPTPFFPDLAVVDLMDEIDWPTVSAGDLLDEPSWPTVGVMPLVDEIGWPDIGQWNVLGAISWPSISNWNVLGSIDWPRINSGTLLGAISWPNIAAFSVLGEIQWPDLGVGSVIGAISWPSVGVSQLLNAIDWPDISVSDLVSGGGRGGFFGTGIGAASGGRVTSTGAATIHRGEMIADPDRLVSDLAAAIDSAGGGGGGGGSMDTSAIERKLDRLNRNISRLASEMGEMELRTDSETIGRVAANGQRNRIGDRDPTV